MFFPDSRNLKEVDMNNTMLYHIAGTRSKIYEAEIGKMKVDESARLIRVAEIRRKYAQDSNLLEYLDKEEEKAKSKVLVNFRELEAKHAFY